jgi:hypothetical protein
VEDLETCLGLEAQVEERSSCLAGELGSMLGTVLHKGQKFFAIT